MLTRKFNSEKQELKEHWTKRVSRQRRIMVEFIDTDVEVATKFIVFYEAQMKQQGVAEDTHQGKASLPGGGSHQDGGSHDGGHGGSSDNDGSDNGDSGDDDDDGGSDDSGNYDFHMEETLNLAVVKQFESYKSKRSKCFTVKPSWKIHDVKVLIRQWSKVPLFDQKLYLTNGSYLFNHLTVSENSIDKDCTINFHLGLDAGADRRKVLKTNLKTKEESFQDLLKRANKNVMTVFYEDEEEMPNTPMPPSLSLITQSITSKMHLVEMKITNRESVLRPALELCSDHQLEKMTQLFQKTKNHGMTEDRLIAASTMLLPEVQQLDEFGDHLKRLRVELIQLFVRAFASEFHDVASTGLITFSCEQFKSAIREVVSYRLRIRQSVEMAEVQAPSVEADQESRCPRIM